MAEPTDRKPAEPAGAHVDDGLCIDVLNGLASDEDTRHALDHLHACPACEARFKVMAVDRELLRSARVPGKGADPRRLESRDWFPVRLPRLVPQLALGAVALALVLLLVLPRLQPTEKADLTYWIPADRELLVQRSGGPTEGDSSLRRGIAAYNAHDLPTAIERLRGAAATEEFDQLRRLYLASALVLDEQPTEALQQLAAVDLAALPEPWQSEALWVRYAALVGARQSTAAGRLLPQLLTRPDPIGALARRRAAPAR